MAAARARTVTSETDASNLAPNTPGEEGSLLAPYSVFTVLEVRVPTHPSDDDPVVVRVQAAVDNVKEEEGLELAPWY